MKVNKSFQLLFSILVLMIYTEKSFSQDEVNLYSARKEHLLKPLLELFEKEENIKINLVTAKAGQLHQRIEKEGRNSPVDILLTTDVGNLWRAQEAGFFQPVKTSKLSMRVDKKYRDPNYYWWGLSLRARIFVYNDKKVNKNELKGYRYLSDPIFKSRILIRSSGNIYNQSLIAHMIEKYGEKYTENWAKGLVNNFARDPAGGDRDQIKGVVAGEGDIAIVNSYYFAKLLNSQNREIYKDIKVHFPEDEKMGTHLNISGAGVMKNAPNYNNAVKLLEFLVSDKAQKIYSFTNFEYPVVTTVGVSQILNNWGNFSPDNISTSVYGKNNRLAIKIADRVGWN